MKLLIHLPFTVCSILVQGESLLGCTVSCRSTVGSSRMYKACVRSIDLFRHTFKASKFFRFNRIFFIVVFQ